MLLKHLVAGLAAVILAAGLSVFAFADTVNLVHWHIQLNPSKIVTDAMLTEKFMQLHPEVSIEVEEVPAAYMEEKVMLAAISGATPNTVRDYLGRLAAWGHQGLLECLDGTLTQKDLDDFYTDVLNGFKINGKLMGYPTCFWMQAYAVNKEILDRAGATFPEGAWTLAEWMEIAEKVKALGIWPTCFFAKNEQGDYWTLINFQIFGAKLWMDGDFTKTTLNSPEGVEALEWMINMVEKGFAPPGTAGRSVIEQKKMFDAGKFAMGPITVAQATSDYRQKKVESGLVDELQDIQIVETPLAPGAPGAGPPFGPNGIVVFKKENSEEVYWTIEWAKFMVCSEDSTFQAIADSQYAVRKSTNPHADSPPHQKLLEILVKYGAYDIGIGSPYYLKCRHLLYPELQQAFMGLENPQKALDDFAEKVAELWK